MSDEWQPLPEVEKQVPELAKIYPPPGGEVRELIEAEREEAVVVEQDAAEVRVNPLRSEHFTHDVAGARMADLPVVRVVGDEDRVAAEGAVKRTADGPDRRIGQPAVEVGADHPRGTLATYTPVPRR